MSSVNFWSLTHLADHDLTRDLATSVSKDRHTTALLLAQIAEFDARRLYASAACSSMFEFCVREHRMSEDVAYKRIRVARTARQHPAVYPALVDGRLNLSGVLLLAPFLRGGSAGELIAAASGMTNAQIEQLLAERFPQPAPRDLVGPVATAPGRAASVGQLAVRPVGMSDSQRIEAGGAPEAATQPSRRARLAPLAPGRFALQVTISGTTRDKLRRAQELLGHAIPSGDLDAVLERALDALIEKLERRKFGATDKPRARSRRSVNPRRIPAAIRREVFERDGGRCTFVSASGRRCESRTRLEFDHATPVARGGETSVANLRLRCRAHNQHDADRAFGPGFMARKREGGKRLPRPHIDALDQRRATFERERAAAHDTCQPNADVIPWLRQLGFRPDEARRAAAACASPPDAPLDERVRAALRRLAPPCTHAPAPSAAPPT